MNHVTLYPSIMSLYTHQLDTHSWKKYCIKNLHRKRFKNSELKYSHQICETFIPIFIFGRTNAIQEDFNSTQIDASKDTWRLDIPSLIPFLFSHVKSNQHNHIFLSPIIINIIPKYIKNYKFHIIFCTFCLYYQIYLFFSTRSHS